MSETISQSSTSSLDDSKGHHDSSESPEKMSTDATDTPKERTSSRKCSSNSEQTKTPKESSSTPESTKDSPAFSLRPRRSTPKSDGKSPLVSSTSPSPKYSMFTKNPSLLDSRRFNPQPFEVVKRKLFRFIAKNEGIPCDDDEDFVLIDSDALNPPAGNSRSSADTKHSSTVRNDGCQGHTEKIDSIDDTNASGSLLAGYTKVKRYQERKSVPLKPADSIKSNIDLCIFSRKISIHQITCHLETPCLSNNCQDTAKSCLIYYDKHYLTLKVVKILKPMTVTRFIESSIDQDHTQIDSTQGSHSESINVHTKIQNDDNHTNLLSNKFSSTSVQCLIVLTQEVTVTSSIINSSSNSNDSFDTSKQIVPIYFYSEYSKIDIKPGQVLEMTKFVALPVQESPEENHLQQYLKSNSECIFDINDDDDSESSNLTIICDDSTDSISPTSTRSKRKRRKVSHGSNSRTSCDDITPNKNLNKQLSSIRIMVDEYWQVNISDYNCLSLVMDSKVITDPYESCEITEASFKLIEFEHLDELEVKSSLLKQVQEYQQKSSFAPSVITLSDPRGDKYCNDRINKDHSQIHSRIPFISIKDKIVSIANPLLLKVNSIGKRKETPSPGLRFTSKIIKDETVEPK